MITEEKIKSLCAEALEGSDKFLLDVHVKAGNNIYIYIDGDHNISIEDCIELSRFIEGRLDRETEDFELHVSSAGIDQPLRFPRQFRKNINRDFEIEISDKKVLKGVLEEVSEQGISLRLFPDKRKKEQVAALVTLNYDEIIAARIIIKF